MSYKFNCHCGNEYKPVEGKCPKCYEQLQQQIEELEKIINAQNDILIAYRLGKKAPGSALDVLLKYRRNNE